MGLVGFTWFGCVWRGLKGFRRPVNRLVFTEGYKDDGDLNETCTIINGLDTMGLNGSRRVRMGLEGFRWVSRGPVVFAIGLDELRGV